MDNAEGNDKPSWEFQTENQPKEPGAGLNRSVTDPISWTASEFIEHDKSSNWFIALAASAGGLAAVFFLLTRDVITVVVIIIAAISFGVMGARKPRVLDYKVDENGITVGPKYYPFSVFKSFAVVNEGALPSVWLMPLKRFMPMLTVYFAPDDADKIITAISNYLPVQNHEPDAVDRFAQRIRF